MAKGHRRMASLRITFILLFLFGLLTLGGWAESPSSWGQETGVYAFTDAKIVVSPSRTIAKGTLLIENGLIKAVGSQVSIPSNTRVFSAKGKTIHATFVEPYALAERFGVEKTEGGVKSSVSSTHDRVHDDTKVSEILELDEESFKEFRDLGYGVVAVAPQGGIFRGQGAVFHTGAQKLGSANLLNDSIYSVLGFEVLGWSKLDGENYPLSMMGNVAFIRQIFLDADWYSRNSGDTSLGSDQPWERRNLASLQQVRSGERPLLVEGADYLEVLRWLTLIPEIGVPELIVVLSGEEWKGLDWLTREADSAYRYILPLDLPKKPKIGPGQSEDQLDLDTLRTWFAAPGNARWLSEKGVRFSFSTHRVKELGEAESFLADSVKAGLNPQTALAALTTEPAKLLGIDGEFGTLSPGKSASFVIRRDEPLSGKKGIEEVWVRGQRHFDPARLLEKTSEKKTDKEDKIAARPFIAAKDYQVRPSMFHHQRSRPGELLIKGATIWTQDDRGVLKNADMLVAAGKIRAIGKNLNAPSAFVIEAQGKHVVPGFVDAHSHTAIDGMVNEPGARVTAQVRMKDVLNPFHHDMFLQLASGVTTANILHGSGNPIGGQAVTVKWKYGQSPKALVMNGAPEGVKFALGENPKQSNWGDKHSTRYPQSRMGVMEVIRGAFTEAKNYRIQKAKNPDHRRDLVSEALLEVLEDKRIIHCHSYRQDEILALIRVAEEVGFTVDVFQHVLEGYKVADELAAHGAAASTFADWWAYKVEVADAIPHNAALMAERGVNVSINSDSGDLARRLNTEAAKSVRYGRMTEVEALNLITKNPAQQLRIDHLVGTLAVGKHADFSVWSKPPLSQGAICEETWIEGEQQFVRVAESVRVSRVEGELKKYRALLKVKKEKKK